MPARSSSLPHLYLKLNKQFWDVVIIFLDSKQCFAQRLPLPPFGGLSTPPPLMSACKCMWNSSSPNLRASAPLPAEQPGDTPMWQHGWRTTSSYRGFLWGRPSTPRWRHQELPDRCSTCSAAALLSSTRTQGQPVLPQEGLSEHLVLSKDSAAELREQASASFAKTFQCWCLNTQITAFSFLQIGGCRYTVTQYIFSMSFFFCLF